MLRNLVFGLSLALALSFSSVLKAEEHSPDDIIMTVSDQVMEVVKKERRNFKDDPEPLKQKILVLLEPHTDFEAFSKGVMGSFYEQATPEQRESFMEDFKNTLIDLYSKALVAFEVKTMNIHETAYRNENSARVVMQVTSPDDSIYLVQYSMRKNDAGKWVVRNVVLDGVNLGLTYRNQFKSAMETNSNDLEIVLATWTKNMEEQPHQQ